MVAKLLTLGIHNELKAAAQPNFKLTSAHTHTYRHTLTHSLTHTQTSAYTFHLNLNRGHNRRLCSISSYSPPPQQDEFTPPGPHWLIHSEPTLEEWWEGGWWGQGSGLRLTFGLPFSHSLRLLTIQDDATRPHKASVTEGVSLVSLTLTSRLNCGTPRPRTCLKWLVDILASSPGVLPLLFLQMFAVCRLMY